MPWELICKFSWLTHLMDVDFQRLLSFNPFAISYAYGSFYRSSDEIHFRNAFSLVWYFSGFKVMWMNFDKCVALELFSCTYLQLNYSFNWFFHRNKCYSRLCDFHSQPWLEKNHTYITVSSNRNVALPNTFQKPAWAITMIMIMCYVENVNNFDYRKTLS